MPKQKSNGGILLFHISTFTWLKMSKSYTTSPTVKQLIDQRVLYPCQGQSFQRSGSQNYGSPIFTLLITISTAIKWSKLITKKREKTEQPSKIRRSLLYHVPSRNPHLGQSRSEASTPLQRLSPCKLHRRPIDNWDLVSVDACRPLQEAYGRQGDVIGRTAD